MLLEISTKTSSLSTSNTFLKSLLFFCDLFIFAQIHPLSQAPVLIAVEKFSIDTGKERCPLCYVHFGNSGSFLGRTECGAGQGGCDRAGETGRGGWQLLSSLIYKVQYLRERIKTLDGIKFQVKIKQH